jgi:hypothetical protein
MTRPARRRFTEDFKQVTYHRIAFSVEKERPATNGLVAPTLQRSRSGDTVTQPSINLADRDQDL